MALAASHGDRGAKGGLNGFTAEALVENTPVMRLFDKMYFDMETRLGDDMYELKMPLRRD